MALTVQEVAQRLSDQREAFLGFLRSRMGDDAEAEDLLQTGLIKAIREAEHVRDDSRLESWFYQILRNSLLDHARSRGAARSRESAWAGLVDGEEFRVHTCACLAGVIATLKSEHARLVREVELEGVSVAVAAGRIGVSPGHASVILHRARREIRKRLELVCGECSAHSCRECDCDV